MCEKSPTVAAAAAAAAAAAWCFAAASYPRWRPRRQDAGAHACGAQDLLCERADLPGLAADHSAGHDDRAGPALRQQHDGGGWRGSRWRGRKLLGQLGLLRSTGRWLRCF
jgi:hypothetical protein